MPKMKAQFSVSFEELDSISAELEVLAKTPRKVTGTQNVINGILPKIESVLSAGYGYEPILEVLKRWNCIINVTTLKKYLTIARANQDEAATSSSDSDGSKTSSDTNLASSSSGSQGTESADKKPNQKMKKPGKPDSSEPTPEDEIPQ